MARKTYILKALMSDVRNSNMSPLRIKQISRAIHNIDTIPIDVLCKLGKAKRVTYQDKDNYFIYRLNNRERLLFSITGDSKIVHDLFDANEIALLKRNQ